jgi:hypothetical protein
MIWFPKKGFVGKRVPIDQLQPGMILDDAVKESFGRVLLPAGSEINEKSMRLIKMWGVLDVIIKTTDEANQGPSPLDLVSPKVQEEANEAVSTLFKHADRSTPLMQEFFRLAVHYQIRAKVRE